MTTASEPSPAVEVGVLNTAAHEGGSTRVCVHSLTEPPETMLVSKSAVGKLNYQSRIIMQQPTVIAARVGDTLVVGFDAIGPLSHCRGILTKKKSKDDRRMKHRFDYQLSALDDCDDILLATRIK